MYGSRKSGNYKAYSDPEVRPTIEINVSHLSDLLLDGIEFDNEVFEERTTKVFDL